MSFAAALAAEKARLEAAIVSAYAEDPQASRDYLWTRYSWLYAAAIASGGGGGDASADNQEIGNQSLLDILALLGDLPEYIRTGIDSSTDIEGIKTLIGDLDDEVAAGSIFQEIANIVSPRLLAIDTKLGDTLTTTFDPMGDPLPVSTGNAYNKFRENFEDFPTTRWSQTLATGDVIMLDGNTVGSSYLTISKCVFTVGSQSSVESIASFQMPFDLTVGLSLSQRTVGQEFSVEVVSDDPPITIPADLEISSIQQATTNLTVNTVQPHGLKPGMRVGVRGCADSRLNYPALVVGTVTSDNQFVTTGGPAGTIPSANVGPLTGGSAGFVYVRSALGGATNGTNILFENASATTASFYVRSGAGDLLPSGVLTGTHPIAIASTASVQPIVGFKVNCFQPTSEMRLTQFADGFQWSDNAVDSLAAHIARYKRSQVVPDPTKNYKFRVRATNNASLSRVVAQIVSAVKTGTTTATITTDVPHGLNALDLINIYGVRNAIASGFPILSAATQVSAIISPTVFQVVIGTAATVTSYGGYVARINGGNLMSALGAIGVVVQSAIRSNNVVTLTANSGWVGVLIGDTVEVIGCRNDVNGGSLGIDGTYRVRFINGLLLELDPVGTTPTGANFSSINCGGAVIKRTDLRLHFVRAIPFERQRVEMLSRPVGDLSSSLPVNIQNIINAVINSGTITTVSTVAQVTNVAAAGLATTGTAIDVASGAISATATSAAATVTVGASYGMTFPVTAVTGTNPTLDLSVEESDDSGATWFKVFDLPRITGIGVYKTPNLVSVGNRVRVVQTLGGGSPNFTRAIQRSQSNFQGVFIRQAIDRLLASTQNLGAVTANLNCQNCERLQLVISAGTITTTAPAIQLEGSDDNGVTWYGLGSPLTAVANTTVQTTIAPANSQLVRARVTTAGVGASLNYVLIKGF
jgi:hypothetical protein